VQEQILDRNPSLKVKVYAVWFEMTLTDRRSFWPKGIFKDGRVTELWDGEKALGSWYARQLRPDDERVVLWDTYLLYDSTARFEETPPRLVSWGGTVVREIQHLERDLLAAAGKPWGP